MSLSKAGKAIHDNEIRVKLYYPASCQARLRERHFFGPRILPNHKTCLSPLNIYIFKGFSRSEYYTFFSISRTISNNLE